jgi:hypothetical protein
LLLIAPFLILAAYFVIRGAVVGESVSASFSARPQRVPEWVVAHSTLEEAVLDGLRHLYPEVRAPSMRSVFHHTWEDGFELAHVRVTATGGFCRLFGASRSSREGWTSSGSSRPCA